MIKKQYGGRVLRSGEDVSGNLFDPTFFGKQNVLQIVGNLSTMLVTKSVLGLLNLVTSVNDNYQSLKCSIT